MIGPAQLFGSTPSADLLSPQRHGEIDEDVFSEQAFRRRSRLEKTDKPVHQRIDAGFGRKGLGCWLDCWFWHCNHLLDGC